jgi:type II secretory pathway pseudopilin PulG
MPNFISYRSARNARQTEQIAKREVKAALREARREQKRDQLRGAPIEGLPDDYQGLARTLSYGDP